MALRTPSPTSPAASGPPGHRAGQARGRVARRLSVSTTPTRLRLLLIGLLLACLAWGAVGAWTVFQHTSAARDVVSTSEPLSLNAQQMYRSLSDADVTATTAFLTGPNESLPDRQRYAADIDQAAADLSNLKGAATSGSDQQLLTSLAAISTALPVYTGYVSQAQAEYSLGYLLTGGSFMQVASEVMHLTLLPAARTIYAQENAGLTADSARATGLPWIAVVVVFAIGIAVVLFRAQRWLWRYTHRRINYGLAVATAVLARLRPVAGRRVHGGASRSAAGRRARLGASGDARPGGHRRPADPRGRDPEPDLAQRQHLVPAGLPVRARPAGPRDRDAADPGGRLLAGRRRACSGRRPRPVTCRPGTR